MKNIDGIINNFSSTELKVSNAYSDGGLEPLFGRLARAALNQNENDPSSISRYAIWANTLRDNIIEAMQLSELGDSDSANKLLIKAANSLSAFSEIQNLFETKLDRQ